MSATDGSECIPELFNRTATMTTSETPRTDALKNVPCPENMHFQDWHQLKYQELCRQLERELAAYDAIINEDGSLQTHEDKLTVLQDMALSYSHASEWEELERKLAEERAAKEAGMVASDFDHAEYKRLRKELVAERDAALAAAVAVQEACAKVCIARAEKVDDTTYEGRLYLAEAVNCEQAILGLNLDALKAGRELLGEHTKDAERWQQHLKLEFTDQGRALETQIIDAAIAAAQEANSDTPAATIRETYVDRNRRLAAAQEEKK